MVLSFHVSDVASKSDSLQMNQPDNLLVPIAAGELIDKITILRIKANRLENPGALANVRKELELLEKIQTTTNSNLNSQGVESLMNELQAINTQLWDVEDSLRLFEKEQRFDQDFIAQARAVYKLNDERAAIKYQINDSCGSGLIEEKSYGERNKKAPN